MSETNEQRWLKRIEHMNQAGKFDIPKSIDVLPCGCSRYNLPDISEAHKVLTELRLITMRYRAAILNKMFYIYRASLENKLKCGSCDREL